MVAVRALLPLLGMVTVLAASPAALAASEARIAWSTYLRAGPGQAYAALDELEHDTPVRLVGCVEAWCRVLDGDLAGYIDRAALTLPRPPPPEGLKGRPTCFVAGQADQHGLAPTRFCGKPAG